MSCRYKDICPSYSGWCEGPKQDFSNCVSFLITAYENTKEELQKYKDTGLIPEQLAEMDREYSVLSREVTSLKERLEAFYNKPMDEIQVENDPEIGTGGPVGDEVW